ncbi:MAG: hypothetical protein GSR85_02985 [Desulfurococcales archaeon]|nr:hypothetical protein [Desulfurococcales archaeon]
MAVYKKERWTYIISVSLIFITFLFLTRNLDYSKMWAYSDLAGYPYKIEYLRNWFMYQWRIEGLGTPNFQQVNYYITIYILSILFNPLIAQKIIFLSIPVISFTSMYWFLKKMNIKPMASIIAGFAYAFNPVIVAFYNSGGISEMITYSFFPFILGNVILFIKNGKIIHIIIAALLGFFIWNIYIYFWLFVLSVPLVLILLMANKSRIKNVVKGAIIFALIQAAILGPLIVNIYGGYYTGIKSGEVDLKKVASYTYDDASLTNLIRLAGNKGTIQARGLLNYNTVTWYNLLGYSISTIITIPLLIINRYNSEHRILILYSWLILIIIVGFILYIKHNPETLSFNPILATLRNPIKLMVVQALYSSILLGLGLDRLNENRLGRFGSHAKLYINSIFIMLLILLLVLYNYPALDGTLGIEKIRDESYTIKNDYYRIPEILSSLDPSYNKYRILVLPWEYSTDLALRVTAPHYFGNVLGGAILGVNISLVKQVFEMITSGNRNLAYILSFFDVKYIILIKNYNDTYSIWSGFKWYKSVSSKYDAYIINYLNSYWLIGKPDYLDEKLSDIPNISKVYEDENIIVYKNLIETSKFYLMSPDRLDVVSKGLVVRETISDNLVVNPSFEEGFKDWIIWPKSNVKLVNESFEGEKAVLLEGIEKYMANIGQHIKGAGYGKRYSVTFYVKTDDIGYVHARVLWYNQTKDLREAAFYSISNIKINNKNIKIINLNDGSSWFLVTGEVNAPEEAIVAKLQILVSPIDRGITPSIIVDNVGLYEITTRLNPGIKTAAPLDFKMINPTRYELHIEISNPMVIVFSESYSKWWKADVINGNGIATTLNSFKCFGGLNCFYINTTGNLTISIEYRLQRIYFTALLLEIIVILSLLFYIIYSFIKNRGYV